MADGEYSGSAEGHTSAVAITQDQFAQLMSAISASQTRMDGQFAEFKAEVRQGQEDIASKAVKKARYEKPYTYKRKGNEEQANFNARVDETLADAESDLALAVAGPATATTPALQRVKESLKKGRSLMADRQKLIRLADRSEYGWQVVDEYTADDLAEGSDDEKRIEKAERAAERKAGKRRKKRSADAAAMAAKPRGGNQFRLVAQAPTAPVPPLAYHQPKRQATLPVTSRPLGPCFGCGEMGHLKHYCPKAAVEGRKWYPIVV